MMRVSIWQQFSSNHSGGYWVVGIFKHVEEARKAFDDLRGMLIDIDRWHREQYAAEKAARETGNPQPFLAETKVAQAYKAEWPKTIDWDCWASYYLEDHPGYKQFNARKAAEGCIDRAVRIVGRTVVVSNPDQTWMSVQPFEGILQRLGGDTIGWDFEFLQTEAVKSFSYHTLLSFTAPDVSSADRIESAVQKYLAGERVSADNPPPWNDDTQNFEKALKTSRLLMREQVERLVKIWRDDYDRYSVVPELALRVASMLLERLALTKTTVRVKRDHLKFVFEGFSFYNGELGISALIAYLEVNGCTDIDFTYVR